MPSPGDHVDMPPAGPCDHVDGAPVAVRSKVAASLDALNAALQDEPIDDEPVQTDIEEALGETPQPRKRKARKQ